MSERVLILDLDTPIYASSAVCEKRTIVVTHTPTGIQKQFENRTAFKALLEQKEKLDQIKDYAIEDIQEPEDVSHGCKILKHMVKNIQEAVQSDSTLFFISGKTNFRDSLELPRKYKSSRANTLRPLLLKDVKQYAINKFNPCICEGEEPDDAIIYRSYELKKQGYTPIISSIDKDCLAYSGLLLFDQDHPERGVVEIPELGSLWIDAKDKVRGNGFLWFCFQAINGDSVDSFKPSELSGKKFGEKSAYKLLNSCKTEKEALEVVLKQYKTWYPEAVTYTAWNGNEYTKYYLQIADMYFKCCRMKTTADDKLDFVEFCKQYGVNP